MRLADDDISVVIGMERYTLRPSLRAATRLERLLDGYDALSARILAGNFSVIVSTIVETSATPITTAQVHDALAGQPLGEHLPAMKSAALNIAAKLAGYDADAPQAQPDTAGERISLREVHRELFRVATGNLGWSPDQAWSATPAEILEARIGRNDLLQIIFGGGEQAASDPHRQSVPDINGNLDRAGLDKLRGKGRLV